LNKDNIFSGKEKGVKWYCGESRRGGIALTRGVHAPRPHGQLDGCPIPLSCEIALELEQKLAFFKGLSYAKVSLYTAPPFKLHFKM